jgi:hypothetical protein
MSNSTGRGHISQSTKPPEAQFLCNTTRRKRAPVESTHISAFELLTLNHLAVALEAHFPAVLQEARLKSKRSS